MRVKLLNLVTKKYLLLGTSVYKEVNMLVCVVSIWQAHMEAVHADWKEYLNLLICEENHLKHMDEYHKVRRTLKLPSQTHTMPSPAQQRVNVCVRPVSQRSTRHSGPAEASRQRARPEVQPRVQRHVSDGGFDHGDRCEYDSI